MAVVGWMMPDGRLERPEERAPDRQFDRDDVDPVQLPVNVRKQLAHESFGIGWQFRPQVTLEASTVMCANRE